MGLKKIFFYSGLSGFSLSQGYSFGEDSFQGGMSFILQGPLSRFLDPTMQTILMFVSFVLTIFFIYSTARFLVQIYEFKILGICIAGIGFFGSIAVFLSPDVNNPLVFFGLGLWLIGIILLVTNREKVLQG